MADIQTPAAGQVSSAPPQNPRKNIEQKKRRKALLKRTVAAVLTLAILGGAGYGTWYFVFREKEDKNTGEPIYDMAYTGSIVSMVNGYGTANAKDSASIVLTQSGVVEELYVTQGQMVYEGDPLYVISSEAAQEALKAAQEAHQVQLDQMNKLRDEMAELYKSRDYLTITAPHAGKLTSVSDLKVGDPLTAGMSIARVVDDTKLKLSLYYSYAYENDIAVGQTATVSVPVLMRDFEGRVEKINKVRMITPEGGVNFEVVLVVDNPGTMTEGMAATARMTDADGVDMYPYADGSFVYYQTTTVSTRADGPVESLSELMNYADVTAGQVLLTQGTSSVDEKIRAKQEQIDQAQKSLDEAWKRVESEQKNLENFSAVAPITGMVTALTLYEGAEVSAGSTAIMIADNSVMTVNIQVDDRSRQYIDVGMELQLTDWYGNFYMGVVDSLAVIGENQNGVTVYPGIVRVDNPTGSLMGGYGLDYSFAAAQSQDCIVIPIGDVRYYSPEGASEPQAVVYIQTDEERENMVDKKLLPADMQEKIPADCIVVEVETGLTDDSNVEIKSGLREGDMVYNNTPSTDGNYWG